MAEKEQELQKKYMEYQILSQQIQQMQKQAQQVESGMGDLMNAKQNLKDLQATKEGTEVILPVSNGIFAKAKLSQNKELLVNVGSGVVLNKSYDDAIELLDKQLKELTEYRHQIMQNLELLASRAAALEQELSKLSA